MSTNDSDLDRLLDDDDDDEEDEDPTPAAKNTPVINEIRRSERRLRRELKEARAELEAVKPYKEKYLTTEAPKVLEEAGVDPSLARLFVKENQNVDLTPDLAKTWAAENGLTIRQPDEPQTSNQTQGTFAPTVGGEVPGPQLIEQSVVDAMLKNPQTQAEGIRLINEGKVKLDNADQVAAGMRR